MDLLFTPLYWQGLGFILLLTSILWLLSLYWKDSSIVDVFWGLGFVLIYWFFVFKSGQELDLKTGLLGILLSIWGLRLSLHIGWRNLGKGEDYRYQAFRAASGRHYWWVSWFQVFALQGVLLWLIATPLAHVALSSPTPFSYWDGLGIGLWLLGFGFEAVADEQLRRFKSKPTNKGKVLDKGLWRYSRHPNYFGDALLWWGYFCFALALPDGILLVFSPLLMTFLLMRVSGVPLLEKRLKSTRPEYADYVQRTSAFFPWWRK
ncbi:MAG TPA: DUF1295 domain-containing protein [Saprospiraceae bacterium]|nr:DUF1295 domain-containing protein [Saprospiraceae bacterium]HMQ83244.1 DUF1295 domain-containing protein [Saprospiraceae bacterium]